MTASPIEELRAREQKIINDLLDPAVSEITMPRGFFPEQVGLREVMCDGIGRIWDTVSKPMRVVYDPRWNARSSLESFRAGVEAGEKEQYERESAVPDGRGNGGQRPARHRGDDQGQDR